MASSLVDYVLLLARNHDEAATFRSSKEEAKRAMSAAGLSEQHQEVLLSKDPDRISEALDAELGNAGAPNPNAVPVRFSCRLVMR